MKPKYTQTQWFLILLLAGVIPLIFSACSEDCVTRRAYLSYEPVYLKATEFRKPIKATASQVLRYPGKIYYKDDKIFINEKGKGIHVIDNQQPEAPQHIRFIEIPGNYDLAIQGNTLYADNYTDLIALDISNLNHIQLLSRLEDIFTQYYQIDEAGIVVDWEEKWQTETISCDELERRPFYQEDAFSPSASPSPLSTTGIGGSLARFAIQNQFLYTLNQSQLLLFDLSKPEKPSASHKVELAWDIETIFPYRDKLFIGSQTGMHILDNSNPGNPVWLSTYQHVRSCDPVVVQDDFAYVTLRSGNICPGETNVLELIDISDLSQPQLVKSFAMENPHGLGVDGNALFVCEGEFGLKAFESDDPRTIGNYLKSHLTQVPAFDVIPLGKILLVIGEQGLYQYDYSDPANLKLLSKIPIVTP